MSRGTWRPRVGVTWGSDARPETLRKLTLYTDRVRQAGGEPVGVFPVRAIGGAVTFVSRHDVGLFQLHVGDGANARDFDGLLFAGGDDVEPTRYGRSPDTDTLRVDCGRDAYELPLLRAALAAGVPVFGICRGLQVLNVALGGTLVQDIPSQLDGAVAHAQGATHEVRVTPGSRLARLALADRTLVNSYHHQGFVGAAGMATGLQPTGVAPDGVVEAVELEPGHYPGYALAVQWHPERPGPAGSDEFERLTRALFGEFLAACVQRAERAAS